MAEPLADEPPAMPLPHIFVELTLALVKPDAVLKIDEIEDIILRSGFTIIQKRRVLLSAEQACEFYFKDYGKIHFASLVTFMCSGQTVALLLGRDKAISYWQELVGPTNPEKAKVTHPDCLRSIYGTNAVQNALHASSGFTDAMKEIQFFFPNFLVEPLPMIEATKDYMTKIINPTLLKGLTQLCKIKPVNPIIWLADWLLDNNPNRASVKWNTDADENANKSVEKKVGAPAEECNPYNMKIKMKLTVKNPFEDKDANY